MAYLDEDLTPAWQKVVIAVLSALYFVAAFMWLAVLLLSECLAPGTDGAMRVTSCAVEHPWRGPLLAVAAFALFAAVFWLGSRNRNAGLAALLVLVAATWWPVLLLFL